MAKRDFDDYYNKVYAQYRELIDGLDEFAQACQSGMVEPSAYDEMMKTVQPVKDLYMSLSYVKYLLDMPAKGSKKAGYKSRMGKFVMSLDKDKSPEAQLEKGKKKINELGELV